MDHVAAIDRIHPALIATIVFVIASANLIAHYGHGRAVFLVIPTTAVLLGAAALISGLKWHDLGVTPSQLRKGLPWAGVVVAVVVLIIAVAVAIGPLREFFLDDRWRSGRTALFAAFVVIPFQTVLPEELLFRGVLQGSLMRTWSVPVSLGVGAILFGLWHILSSLNLAGGNKGLHEVFGGGDFGRIAGVVLSVVATTVAGLVFGWLRYKTDSLLTPIALHWALNATGALGAALAWRL
ncbi:CPBP family intramembrane metalloprotease [Gordonia sp. X0973]|uniref:CPBP family intramembrane glutamic endopeptidase n=1 Tax=Gordonia sp. X0973 TaxID=2742602 RepID=UPI000F533542|nr:CPBP family intramembrane glutamic endopeptidase [Gordonia sp. X0973]QKT07346.1 CPBP family intramembrane metalloprotease [Gordonia sp. X0973]